MSKLNRLTITMRNFLLLSLLFIQKVAVTQKVDTSLLSELNWRMIGPHRGGRTIGAVGVPSQPNVFYVGVNNGGVWKTTDFGRTWKPIFDDQPTGSIGDVAVAPSNPEIIYVGSGEGVQRPDLSVGDGIYRSGDGGKTWRNTGLKDAQQIGGLAIDRNDANRVFVAALGHPYGPNAERGIFRTRDGGEHWEKVLYIDENTGAVQVTIDPQNSKVIYADLWAARQGPWENGEWDGPNSGLYKSTDGGDSWRKLTRGLPTPAEGLGRIGFGIAPSDPKRLYATVDAGEKGGIYRSDDAGETWYLQNPDERLWGRGSDFAEIKVDPTDPDIVYTADVVVWKSIDGAKTWKAFRGAPGGDDYHRIWINPGNPKIMLIAADQGAIVTVNGGETFSSWYNQPTAQFYHVSTDNQFPYNVYGGQQESGSVGIASRGNDGQITFREWHPVGVEEYGYVAVDPLNPDLIYGGKLTRYDRRTGQVQNVAPEPVRTGRYRFLRTAPVVFSPVDPKTLYFAGNVIFKTTNGGHSWTEISTDLTRDHWEVPPSVGVYNSEALQKMKRRGVVYALAPSFKDINTLWAGTDDGLIYITRDAGKHWTNITPSSVTDWSKVSIIDAGHFDVNTAYVAVNRIRCDDQHPHIFRTHDGGKHWDEIVNGLPEDPVNVVREDPFKKGLLYAGSERAVYVSFDDGANWQSLRRNMPATSIRDLVIKDNDVVVGTHGRSFWILDDISRLRQLPVSTAMPILFKPAVATRVRWNTNPDTPLPQEEPAGQNPPDGAVLDYFLPQNAKNVSITLKTKPAGGSTAIVVASFTSHDSAVALPRLNIPEYWIREDASLQSTAGTHRFTWDLHYQRLPLPASFPIAAVFEETAPDANSPWVNPGTYEVILDVDGNKISRWLVVKMDPRVTSGTPAIQAQFDLSMRCYNARKHILSMKLILETSKTFSAEEKKTWLAQGDQPKGYRGLNVLDNGFASLLNILQDTEMMPTSQTEAAVKTLETELGRLAMAFGKLEK